MAKTTLFLSALAAVLAIANPFQDSQQTKETPLTPVQTAANFKAAEQAQQLRSANLETRRQTYAQLLRWSLDNAEVLTAIKTWASGDDLELAWSAELLLRERDYRSAQRTRESSWLGGLTPSPFERQRQLLFDLQDLFVSPLNGWAEHPFQGLPDGLQRDASTRVKSEEFKLESGPDGVKVEWMEDVDGDRVQRSFEAESIEALLEQHPELKDKLSIGSGLGQTPWTQDPWSSLRQRMGQAMAPFGQRQMEPRSLQSPRSMQPMRTDILGVYVSAPERRTKPLKGVDADRGLTILEVLPGSLAAELGLKPGDTILSCDQTEVRSTEDIQRALRMRLPHELLRVETCDAEGVRSWHEWDPGETEVH